MTVKQAPCILLVDSEPKWSKAARSALEEQGKYNVQSATTIDAALNFSYCDGFDLILINAALAFDNDNLSRFKEIVHLYPGKVLVVSDVDSITTAIQCSNWADYAEKPLSLDEYLASIHSLAGWLRRRQNNLTYPLGAEDE
jgi:DNA-binding NtrC family response regulator